MSEKILFISSTNLTVNPRLLKELKLALPLRYKVDFIGFRLGNWSDVIDKKIIKDINANFHYIPITRKPFVSWFISSIIEKFTQKLYYFFKANLKINAYAYSKRSFLLCKYLRKNKKQYDLIIAHTLPTLYPAYKFAKQTNTNFIFDIEDYHPGEIVTVDAKNEKTRRIFLMQKLLPKASYLTYASPLIGKFSLNLLNNYPVNQHQLINNCFSKSEFQFKENTSKKIKFVWFSQNIAAGRGLELVIPALAKYKDKIELTLIGNLYAGFHKDFLSGYDDFINFIEPLPPKELNLKLSEFDIGLAIEISNVDINKDIALSNKIWAYFQSGLYVLATDTQAQKQFVGEHEDIGVVSGQDIERFTESIENIIKNIDNIRNKKQDRFIYAQKIAWEVESEKLTDIWSRLLTT
jgi:glycosyltransferase involved in cell wall biosynthesis